MKVRPIKPEEVKRGTAVQFRSWAAEPFSWGVILMVRDGRAIIGRPYAYACKDYDTKQALMGYETTDHSVNTMHYTFDVCESSNGEVKTFLT